ncbi:transcriptional regulator [Jatrophihabitans fulvus]
MTAGITPSPRLPVDLLDAHRLDRPASDAVARVRDLLLTRQGRLVTVIACDVNAGIGDLPDDRLHQPPRDTGFAAAKVPLMEVMAAGARPVVLIDTLGMDRTSASGRAVLLGIADCVALSGHRPVVTGSDETNIATTQTSVGVSVVGVAADDELRLGDAQPGDTVYVVGTPKDGLTVPYAESDPDVVTPREVAALLSLADVHEILPVGSRGVAREAADLAALAGLRLELIDGHGIDVTISAGSSTCVLVSAPSGAGDAIAAATGMPVDAVGRLTASAPKVR